MKQWLSIVAYLIDDSKYLIKCIEAHAELEKYPNKYAQSNQLLLVRFMIIKSEVLRKLNYHFWFVYEKVSDQSNVAEDAHHLKNVNCKIQSFIQIYIQQYLLPSN